MRKVAAVVRCLPVLAVVLLTACGAPSSPNPSEGTAVPQAKFAVIDVNRFAAMAKERGVVILDVRTPDEFAQEHIRGAVNIDVGAADFAQKVAALDKKATYLVQCRSGRRSTQACEQMAGMGFTRLYNLEGGITAWTAGGKPVEK